MESGVSSVVRLNEPETYDRAVFEAAAMQHLDMWFADCTAPPQRALSDFFAAADAAEGVVAVHCLAGLGRTGTLASIGTDRTCHDWVAAYRKARERNRRAAALPVPGGTPASFQRTWWGQTIPRIACCLTMSPRVTLRCRRTPPRALSK